MKKFASEKVPEVPIRENFFQSFSTKFLSLLYMRSLAYKISKCASANYMYNPKLRCVICTGVTLFVVSFNIARLNHVSHLHFIKQSKSRPLAFTAMRQGVVRFFRWGNLQCFFQFLHVNLDNQRECDYMQLKVHTVHVQYDCV